MGFTKTNFIVILLQVFYLSIYGQTPTYLDYTYIETTHSFYKFHTTRTSWQKAVNTCASEGATLFYPTNKCEADSVVQRWSQTPAYGWAFIGISRINDGEFKTMDGQLIWDVYNNWSPGEPNNANGDEKCAVLLRDGTINDAQCVNTYPFICKKKLDTNDKQGVCDQVQKDKETSINFRKDYTYIEDSKKFYKIHTVSKNWQDAKIMCQKEGATLFYPKSNCEANVVLQFWNQTQPFEKVFVGISSQTEGLFETLDGRSVWTVYNKWYPGEPSNSNGNDLCVVLSRDGMLDDVGCTANYPFICTKPLEPNKEVAVCDKPEIDDVAANNIRKDYKYLQDTQSLYKIHTILRTWEEIKTTCENEGATLFYPENECEANTLLEFWNKTQPFVEIYIGLYNPTEEISLLNFQTIDGREGWSIYNNWRRGEPNNVNGQENCVFLLREGTLKDDKCDKKSAFVCTKRTTKENAFCDRPKASDKFRKDYTYLEEAQSYYKMHTLFKIWSEAKLTCEKEGAILYYPESKCEANLVLNFWIKNLPSRRIHVGISSLTRGLFETVNGSPIWKAYSKWQPSQPNNAHEEEFCVTMHRDELAYSDEKCSKKLPFICKRKLLPRKSNYGCDIPDKNDIALTTFRSDYTYLENTQSLYKFHTVYDNWDNAKRICENEGAMLFYPENRCELNTVMTFWNESQSYLTSTRVLDTLFIGIQKISENQYQSFDGRREPDLFLDWEETVPTAVGNNKMCVILYRYNNLNQLIECERQLLFLCKKTLDSGSRDAFCDNPSIGEEVTENTQNNYIFLNDTQSFYKFHKVAHTWQDAKNICNKEKADLFYPTNECEAKAVLDYWTQFQSFNWVFVGLTSPVEGIFETIDNKPIWDVYNNWRSGEPNNANRNEQCVVLLRDGTLNDVHCLKSYQFICKRQQRLQTNDALCDRAAITDKSKISFRKDYTFLSDTRSFYKIHTIQHGWEEAKKICDREGATLFYPKNKCEANVILEYWNQTQAFNSIYVGIWSPSKGLFQTIGGRPAWDVYNNWGPGEPDNANNNEKCVSLFRDGTLQDVQCSISLPFICEKKSDETLEGAICDKIEESPEQNLGFRKDYKYIKDTRSFYKIHTIFSNWPDAKEACEQEGTNLFFAENELEAKAVLKFWKQTQSYDKIYVGVSNPSQNSSPSLSNFVTIDGRPANKTYNKWRQDEPNNSDGEEYCVTLFRDGTLSDDRCGNNMAFICKITVDSFVATSIHGKPEANGGDEVNFRKDYTYFEDTQSFYKFHTKFSSWQQAKQTCTAEGAYLFYPENKCEANVVLTFWQKTQFFRRIFIGVSSAETGIFKTILGTPIWLVYNNWLPGEPNNSDFNEGCVVLYKNGTLNDEQCEIKMPFLCKKKIFLEKDSSCSKLEFDEERLIMKDYTYVKDTQSLYKIHTVSQSWFDAKKVCMKEGSSLFYAENECEANSVIKFWEQTQPFTHVFVGLSSSVKGKFQTIDGRPIWEVHNKWRSSQPDNSDNKEDCVVMYREDGAFNDDWCEKKFGFICKKKINSNKGVDVCNKPKKYTKQITDYLKDYTYLDDIQNLYKIHTILQNWENAKKTCADEGATLFYPENGAEFSAVQTFWRNTQVYGQLYAGLTFTNSGTFESVDGKSIKDLYNKWAADKSTITSGCVLLRRDGTLDLNDCQPALPFICKKAMDVSKGNLFCKTSHADYRYSDAQKKCYKFHLTPMYWNDARAACKSEGSDLAVINSQAEANFLVKITNQAPKDNIKGDYLAGAVHLGFYKGNDRTWITTTGKTLQETGYTKWSYTQPDGGDIESCGSMFYNGELNDISCIDRKCFFICEQDFNIPKDNTTLA